MAETLEPSFVGEIDTSAPFESVRAAATHFGGFGFWKPSSHNNLDVSQNNVDEAGMVAEVGELEKELIAKEEEALNVLKSLESIKATVEELKSKLLGKEDQENCYMNLLKELNQTKMNLCKTTQDLAGIRDSVELLNKRLEEERAAFDKKRDRLHSENAAEISKEIRRLTSHEVEQTRNKLQTAEMRLDAARKMKEAARAAEAVAIAEIKAVTKRRRGNVEESLQEELQERIEETALEIRSSRRTLEEGLKRVNSAKMEEEEEEQRKRSSSSCSAKYKNHFLMDVNGLNLMMNNEGTSSSVAVLKPTMSIGQILSKKLLLAEEAGMMMNHRKVSLGQILGKTSNGGGGEGKEKPKTVNGKRKRFGFAILSNKDSKKNINNKKKKIALDLK